MTVFLSPILHFGHTSLDLLHALGNFLNLEDSNITLCAHHTCCTVLANSFFWGVVLELGGKDGTGHGGLYQHKSRHIADFRICDQSSLLSPTEDKGQNNRKELFLYYNQDCQCSTTLNFYRTLANHANYQAHMCRLNRLCRSVVGLSHPRLFEPYTATHLSRHVCSG